MSKFSLLLTEQENPRSALIDRVPTIEMLNIINLEDSTVAAAVGVEVGPIARAVDAIAGALRRGGRFFYIGAGTSGRLGVLDASECAPTFNVPGNLVQGIIAGGESALVRATEASEDDPSSGARDLLARGFTSQDVVCGIAASGRTPYVLGAIAKAREMGAVTIGLSCVPGSELAQAAEIAITPITGPEVVTGSTRMKAGTATKMVLNMLTTGAMIRLGMTYGNLMVNVQPKNEKLVDRARRIISRATGVNEEQAATLLESSGRNVRTAIVMAHLGLGRVEAEARLAAAGNIVARVLEGN
ncbi:MAG TPA: N-acetylmuramic acid 6-phosphate etherase [Bryobacteraceae bacterium]|nr:N-acetylmuramic acid 6-phosphate etherase [Bryobacteraceae bacterium]